jgi:hypothetical protein
MKEKILLKSRMEGFSLILFLFMLAKLTVELFDRIYIRKAVFFTRFVNLICILTLLFFLND